MKAKQRQRQTGKEGETGQRATYLRGFNMGLEQGGDDERMRKNAGLHGRERDRQKSEKILKGCLKKERTKKFSNVLTSLTASDFSYMCLGIFYSRVIMKRCFL